MPALELHSVGRQLPTEDTSASVLQPAAPNSMGEPPCLVLAQALPITKMLESLVAKLLPLASFT